MKNAITGTLALLSDGIRKAKPAASRHHAMFGKVNNIRLRRPNVSMLQIAGNAKTKQTSPYPNDARSACVVLYPASEKTVEE